MNKADAIKRINDRLGKPALTDKNTHFSNVVVYGTDEGWWLKIPFLTFKQELHFVLNNEKTKTFQHLKVNANQILSPGMNSAARTAPPTPSCRRPTRSAWSTCSKAAASTTSPNTWSTNTATRFITERPPSRHSPQKDAM